MNKKKYLPILIFISLISIIGLNHLTILPVDAETVTFDDPLNTDPDDPEGSVVGIIFNIVRWVQGSASIVAVLLIIVSGFIYMFAGVNPSLLETAKKILTYTVVGYLVIFLGTSVIIEILAAVSKDADIQQMLANNRMQVNDANTVIQNISTRLAQIFGILGTLVILVSGVIYMTAATSERHEMARKTLIYAVIGMVVVFLAWSIVQMISSFVL